MGKRVLKDVDSDSNEHFISFFSVWSDRLKAQCEGIKLHGALETSVDHIENVYYMKEREKARASKRADWIHFSLAGSMWQRQLGRKNTSFFSHFSATKQQPIALTTSGIFSSTLLWAECSGGSAILGANSQVYIGKLHFSTRETHQLNTLSQLDGCRIPTKCLSYTERILSCTKVWLGFMWVYLCVDLSVRIQFKFLKLHTLIIIDPAISAKCKNSEICRERFAIFVFFLHGCPVSMKLCHCNIVTIAIV